jgi:hypothetical protein
MCVMRRRNLKSPLLCMRQRKSALRGKRQLGSSLFERPSRRQSMPDGEFASTCPERLQHALSSRLTLGIVLVCTTYALFGDDIRLASFGALSDATFEILATVVFFVLSLEIVLQSIATVQYLPCHRSVCCKGRMAVYWTAGSFFFWLDLLSTASLVFEISWMTTGSFQSQSTQDAIQAARAGRLSRVGARVGRLVKLVRLVRLLRFFRFYRYIIKVVQGSDAPLRDMGPHRGNSTETVDESETARTFSLARLFRPTRIGSALSDMITRRVIMGTLISLAVIPLLMLSPSDGTAEFAANSMLETMQDGHALNEHLRSFRTTPDLQPLLLVQVNGTVLFEDSIQLNQLRSTEILVGLAQDTARNQSATVVKGIRSTIAADAAISIALTTLVAGFLVSSALILSHDTTEVLVAPLESTIAVARHMQSQPLQPIHSSVLEAAQNGAETGRIVQALMNIPRLLKLTFGSYGAVIASSMANDQGSIDLCLPSRLSDGVLLAIRIPSAHRLAGILGGKAVRLLNCYWETIQSVIATHRGEVLTSTAAVCLVRWTYDSESRGDTDLTSLMPADPLTLRGQFSTMRRQKEQSWCASQALDACRVIQARVAAWSAGERPSPLDPLTRAECRALGEALDAKPLPSVHCALHCGRHCVGLFGSPHQVCLSTGGLSAEQTLRAAAIAVRLRRPLVMSDSFVGLLPRSAHAHLVPLLRCRPRPWGVCTMQEEGSLEDQVAHMMASGSSSSEGGWSEEEQSLLRRMTPPPFSRIGSTPTSKGEFDQNPTSPLGLYGLLFDLGTTSLVPWPDWLPSPSVSSAAEVRIRTKLCAMALRWPARKPKLGEEDSVEALLSSCREIDESVLVIRSILQGPPELLAECRRQRYVWLGIEM